VLRPIGIAVDHLDGEGVYALRIGPYSLIILCNMRFRSALRSVAGGARSNSYRSARMREKTVPKATLTVQAEHVPTVGVGRTTYF